MKKLLSCVAFAVSLFGAGQAQAQYRERPFTWTGFYAGAHLGYAWGHADVSDTTGGVTPGPFGYSPRGAFLGGTAGYNWQFQSLVLGVEGDFGYMNLKGSGVIPSSNPAAHQDLTLDAGLYGVAAGRVGVAFGSTLLYGKGGFAYFGGKASQTTTNPGYITTPTGAFTGGAYGGGVEHFISSSVSVKLEYLHFNFGSEGGLQTSISDPPVGYKYLNSTSLNADTVKIGIAAHF
ncbi:MAG: porin family protein [Hyphomicrobiales bacterium]|nr:MAG: porin family protein [Hyphomicrobiales bacterium]